MSVRKVRVGIIGTGGMAHAHAKHFRELPGVVLAACCDVDESKAQKFAADHEIPEVYTDYREMFRNAPLEAVSSVTPDAVHAEVAVAAAKAGLHILSEKPLAVSVKEGRAMLRAVRRAGVMHMVNFSYRDAPALQAAATRIQRGDIGRVMHVETSYLQSWLCSRGWGDWRTSSQWLWRLSTEHGSAGTLGDIGCHLYDATALLAGPIRSISCRLETFSKGVRGNRVGEYVLDANDSFVSTVQFAHGALGAVHATRWASGHLNSLRFRVYGDAGAIEVDLDHSLREIRMCRGARNLDRAQWRSVRVPETPNNYRRFVRAIRTGEPDPSDFANALQVQACLAASIRSHEENRPAPV